MSKIIRVRYEKGVLRPLEPLNLEEGQELTVRIVDVEERRKMLKKYKGVLGPVSREIIEEAIEEAESL